MPPPPPIHAIHTQNEGILTKNKGFRICCCPGESLPCYYHADPCEDDCPEGADNVYVFCEQAPEGDEIFAFEGACYVVDGSTEYDALPDGGVEAPIILTFESCLECCGTDGGFGCPYCRGNGSICDTSIDDPISLYLTINSLVTSWGLGDSWTDIDLTLTPQWSSQCYWKIDDLHINGNSGNYYIEYVSVFCTNTVEGDYWIYVHCGPGAFGFTVIVLHEDYSHTIPYHYAECPFGHYDHPGGHCISASADIV